MVNLVAQSDSTIGFRLMRTLCIVVESENEAGRDVARQTTAHNSRSQALRLVVIVNTLGGTAERHLEQRVAVEDDSNGGEQRERERTMRGRLVRAVKCVRLVVLELTAFENGLLVGRQDHRARLGASELGLRVDVSVH